MEKETSYPHYPQIANLIGTNHISVRGREYTVHISAPPTTANTAELQAALQLNRKILQQSQHSLQESIQHTLYPHETNISYDSAIQDALMAHLNVNVLVPMLNMRGDEAHFEIADTLEAGQRVDLLWSQAEHHLASLSVSAGEFQHTSFEANSSSILWFFGMLLLIAIIIHAI